MAERVAALTGLDRKLVERMGGKVDTSTFLRELDRDKELVGSPYDGTVAGFDPTPDAARSRAPDAVLEAITAPLTSAMLAHYSSELKLAARGALFPAQRRDRQALELRPGPGRPRIHARAAQRARARSAP